MLRLVRRLPHIPTSVQTRPAKPLIPLNQHRRLLSTAIRMSSNDIQRISTEKAFPVAGPYSQAVRAGPYIFVSGQIPGTPSGDIVMGDIKARTAACCDNIKAVLAAAGSSLDRVVKTTVFLRDMAFFPDMNAEYEKHFPHRPARSCVAVVGLPKGVPVEIECIALPGIGEEEGLRFE